MPHRRRGGKRCRSHHLRQSFHPVEQLRLIQHIRVGEPACVRSPELNDQTVWRDHALKLEPMGLVVSRINALLPVGWPRTWAKGPVDESKAAICWRSRSTDCSNETRSMSVPLRDIVYYG